MPMKIRHRLDLDLATVPQIAKQLERRGITFVLAHISPDGSGSVHHSGTVADAIAMSEATLAFLAQLDEPDAATP